MPSVIVAESAKAQLKANPSKYVIVLITDLSTSELPSKVPSIMHS